MNTHCQPANPTWPSKVMRIAVIIMPANIAPTCPIAVKIDARFEISLDLLFEKGKQSAIFMASLCAVDWECQYGQVSTYYQDPRMNITPL